ncbi:MAG: 50S ribosomal protein L25 [Gemmatimonadota bacterium]
MAQVSLAAVSRKESGKGAARSLRRDGRVPATMYGHGIAARSLSVDHKLLTKLLDVIGGEAALVDVSIDNEAPVKALVREVQRNPVRRADVIHIDLYAVVATEAITVEVPVHIIGVADGVRNHGGVLDHHLHRLTVKVLPADIPEHIDVDVTALGVGDSIHVGDIKIAKGELMNEDTVSIVSVIQARAEVAAAAVEPTDASPEVIKKGKADEAEAAGE